MVPGRDKLNRAATGHHWLRVLEELLLAHQEAGGTGAAKELVPRDEHGILCQQVLEGVQVM